MKILIQTLLYDEIEIDKKVQLEKILKNPDDSDIDYFIEVDLGYPDNIKKRTIFHFDPKTKLFLKINKMNI